MDTSGQAAEQIVRYSTITIVFFNFFSKILYDLCNHTKVESLNGQVDEQLLSLEHTISNISPFSAARFIRN